MRGSRRTATLRAQTVNCSRSPDLFPRKVPVQARFAGKPQDALAEMSRSTSELPLSTELASERRYALRDAGAAVDGRSAARRA